MSAPLDSELRAKHSVSCRSAVMVQQPGLSISVKAAAGPCSASQEG